MKTGILGLNIIKEFEGYHTQLPDGSCEAYLDRIAVPPVWTIGYGCTEGVHDGLVWTKRQAEANLLKEVAQTEHEVAQYLKVPLNQNQYDALISIGYNLKGGIAKAPTLMKYINAEDWTKAADAFMLYCKAGKKIIKGLERRRTMERQLFNTPVKKEVIQSSTVLTTFQRIRNAIVAFFGTYFSGEALSSYFDTGKEFFYEARQFIDNNKVVAAMAAAGVVWGVLKWAESRKVKEAQDGNWTPSGMREDV